MGSLPQISLPVTEDFVIPLPPLPVQQEIVRILDKFTELTHELTHELTLRKKQYAYYRDKLLTFENDVEWKTLGAFTKIVRGRRLTREQLSNEYTIPVYHGGLEPLGYYYESNREANTVMIINVGASAGTVGFSSQKFWSSDGCYCIENTEEFIPKYLYFVLQKQEYNIKARVRVAGIPTLDAGVIERLEIPLPSLEVQRRIVNVLDKFEAVCNDLKIGLPAEINARQKQYEYYREKLLTFEKLRDNCRGTREQRAESREQRAESREQRGLNFTGTCSEWLT